MNITVFRNIIVTFVIKYNFFVKYALKGHLAEEDVGSSVNVLNWEWGYGMEGQQNFSFSV